MIRVTQRLANETHYHVTAASIYRQDVTLSCRLTLAPTSHRYCKTLTWL